MFLDYNRFLDKDKNTVLLVDYQVPYRNLVFIAQNGGYFAELNVSVEFIHGDSITLKQDVTDYIGISNKADTASFAKSYLNRLSFVLDNSASEVRFIAVDVNTLDSFVWNFPIQKLTPNAILSDLELNSEVRSDTLQYLAKFHRKKVLYRPEPSILINRSYNDYVYLYLEAYQHTESVNGSNLLILSLEKDSLLVMEDYIDYEPSKASESFSLKIPLADLKLGIYNGTVTLQSGDTKEERSFEFVLVEDAEEFAFLFPNPDDEFILMRYFMGNRVPVDWKSFSFEKKRRYITHFWSNMASTTKRDVKSIMSLVQERIDYTDRYFGHLAAGWTSDMGRIYIRNGAADDVDKDVGTDVSRFVRKDFQIWKYSTGNKPVYVFVDMQMNGNYRLIYADSDDMENSDPDWKRFVGSDFDDSRLDN
jgi:GWxTD domain-containing protein